MKHQNAIAPLHIRPVLRTDIADIRHLAKLLDTINLPKDPDAVAEMVSQSEASFKRLTVSAKVPVAACNSIYMLVAVKGDRLLGTASLLSHHGTPDDPHYYLRVVEQTVHSTQLNSHHRRHLLQLGRDLEPWTELGGLVVHPEARGQGIGKLLLAARLMMVAKNPAWFCKRLLAELLPPRQQDGSNAFWEALGAPLTGLNYYRADLLCRTDKEFIESLFPRHQIVMELLPAEAQEVVGQVNAETVPVLHLLQRAGFSFLNTIDPFDGGPHYGASLEEVTPVQRCRSLVCLDHPPTEECANVLLAHPTLHQFHPIPAQICGDGLRITKPVIHSLHLHPGDLVWIMPLDW